MMFGSTVGTGSRTKMVDLSWAAVGDRCRWLLAAVILAVSPALTYAQVEAITPVYVVVERENVPIQCRVGSASYPVKVVTAGQVLKADGQSSSMYRVEYPAGMNAFVKVEEASVQGDGKSLSLNRPSRLMAPNAEGGVSWWYLLEKELDAGTSLQVQKTVKGPDGKDSGYLVPAPAGSKGYIRRDYVRTANQAEIDRFLGKTLEPVKPAEPAAAPPSTAPSSSPSAAPTPTQPAPTPSATPSTTPPAGTTPDPSAPGAVTINVKPAAGAADGTPAAPAVTPPAPGGAQPVEIVTPSTTVPPQAAPAVPAAPRRLQAVDAETLTKLFNDARTAPIDTVEFDAVIGEFERAIAALPGDASTPRLRTQLEQRVTFLKLRSELQATLRQTVASSDALKQQADQMKDELRRLEGLRQYTVVGRLMASSVYDGRTLPLMYRVLSPEPTSTRTLAYVAPEANSDIVDKVGKLVGVVGDSRLDESLRVNIIVPTRVELLGVVPTPSSRPAPAAPDQNK